MTAIHNLRLGGKVMVAAAVIAALALAAGVEAQEEPCPSLPSGGSWPFADVDAGHWAAAFICSVSLQGAMDGCGGSFFCPEDYVLREELVASVFTVGPGSGTSEKFGHSAVFVVSRTGDTAGISYGGSRGFEGGLADFVRGYNAEGRTVLLTVLNTTPAQDASMIDFLRSNPDGGISRTGLGADVMVRENCAQAVGNTLEAGGVFPAGTNPSQSLGGWLSTPGLLLQRVQGVDINLGTIVFRPDPTPERERFLQYFLDIGPPEPTQ